MKYRVLFLIVLFAVLLGLAGCSGVGSTTTTSAEVVHVTLSDGKITSDHSTFTAGTPYHFVVTNTGRVAHQFMMAPMGDEWDYDHMSMHERQQMALYQYDQVAPGATKTFAYTFPASAVGQHYGFACDREGDWRDSGMWSAFTVQAHP